MLLLHLLTMIPQLLGIGGAKSVVTDSLLGLGQCFAQPTSYFTGCGQYLAIDTTMYRC